MHGFLCQETETVEDCPVTELDDQSLEVLQKFWNFGDIIEATEGAVDSILARLRNGCNKFTKFTDLIYWLASSGLPSGVNSRLYSVCLQCYATWEGQLTSSERPGYHTWVTYSV